MPRSESSIQSPSHSALPRHPRPGRRRKLSSKLSRRQTGISILLPLYLGGSDELFQFPYCFPADLGFALGHRDTFRSTLAWESSGRRRVHDVIGPCASRALRRKSIPADGGAQWRCVGVQPLLAFSPGLPVFARCLQEKQSMCCSRMVSLNVYKLPLSFMALSHSLLLLSG